MGGSNCLSMRKYLILLIAVALVAGVFAGCTAQANNYKYQPGDIVGFSEYGDSSRAAYCVIGYGEKSGDYIFQPVTKDLKDNWIKMGNTGLKQDTQNDFESDKYIKIGTTQLPLK